MEGQMRRSATDGVSGHWAIAILIAGVVGAASIVAGTASAATDGPTAVTIQLRGAPVEAGHRVAVGDTVELVGHVRAGSRTGPKRWHLMSEPRGARGKRAARLTGASRLDAHLQMHVRGRYRLRLTVGRGAGRGTRAVAVLGVPPTPLVPIDQ